MKVLKKSLIIVLIHSILMQSSAVHAFGFSSAMRHVSGSIQEFLFTGKDASKHQMFLAVGVAGIVVASTALWCIVSMKTKQPTRPVEQEPLWYDGILQKKVDSTYFKNCLLLHFNDVFKNFDQEQKSSIEKNIQEIFAPYLSQSLNEESRKKLTEDLKEWAQLLGSGADWKLVNTSLKSGNTVVDRDPVLISPSEESLDASLVALRSVINMKAQEIANTNGQICRDITGIKNDLLRCIPGILHDYDESSHGAFKAVVEEIFNQYNLSTISSKMRKGLAQDLNNFDEIMKKAQDKMQANVS